MEIPTQIQAQPVLPDTEVSEVSSVALELMSQDAITSQGKSFKTTEPSIYMVPIYDRSF